jgi:hypothetical protein
MIQELAASEGMETTTSKTARQLRVSWGTAFQLYAPAGRVEFCIQPLRNAGLDEEANRLLAQLQELAGHDMTDAYPNVDATALVEHWDRFLSEFLPKYLEISGKARARGQSPV